MNPQSVTLFREQVYSRKHTLHQLRMKLQGLPRDQQWTALLSVFLDTSRSESAFTDQEIAGRMLVDVEPQCTDPLDHVLRAIAPCWNVSVEQLPIYLSRVFGFGAVTESATQLKSSFPQDSREARALDTVCWWLRGQQAGQLREGTNDTPTRREHR